MSNADVSSSSLEAEELSGSILNIHDKLRPQRNRVKRRWVEDSPCQLNRSPSPRQLKFSPEPFAPSRQSAQDFPLLRKRQRHLEPKKVSSVHRKSRSHSGRHETTATGISTDIDPLSNFCSRVKTPPSRTPRAGSNACSSIYIDDTHREQPPKQQRQIGNYIVEMGALIGSGGYSSVYSVRDTHSHRQYASKIVQFASNVLPHIRANSSDEVRTLTSSRGVSHVIQSLAHDTANTDRIEMLMELGQGDSQEISHSIQEKDGGLSIEFIRYWGGQVLQAVAAVHTHNIVHADLKPANFVVVNGSSKLIDFGIANPVPSNTSSVHRQSAVGTSLYMAPETLTTTAIKTTKTTTSSSKSSKSSSSSSSKSSLSSPTAASTTSATISGATATSEMSRQNSYRHPNSDDYEPMYRVTKASDVWSCGVILFEMMYRRHPFDMATYSHDAQAGKSHEVTHKTHTRDGTAVPSASHEVIRDCLQLDASKRCTAQSAARSSFFTPVSVDSQASMDIAWGIRSCCVQQSSCCPASRGSNDGETQARDWTVSDNHEFRKDRKRRHEFEEVVRGLYAKLVKMNTGNRYCK